MPLSFSFYRHFPPPWEKVSGIRFKGEEAVREALEKYAIGYERQKKFETCKDKNPLPFDFYFSLEGKEFLVEYDGGQHFYPVEMMGGEEEFIKIKRRDGIKNSFAAENGYILIRIPFTCNDIDKELSAQIEKEIGHLLTRCQ